METYTKKPSINVVFQGLVGRMTGYWLPHKTGPYRTSINAITNGEEWYVKVKENHQFEMNGSRITNSKKKKKFVNPDNIENLDSKRDIAEKEIYAEVPIVIKITKEDFIYITKRENKKYYINNNINTIINKYKSNVNEYNCNLLNKILNNDYKRLDRQEINLESNTYNKLIRPILNAYNRHQKIMYIKNKNKNINAYNIYFHDNQIIITVWNGRRLNS